MNSRNRVLARKVVTTVRFWNLPRKTFSNDAAGGGSGSDHIPPIHEDGGMLGMTNTTDQYDIAIVGGGLVGMALACSLSSMPLTKQLNVAIIDSNPFLKQSTFLKINDFPDPRVSTVTPATISLFKDVGAWQYVQQHRHAFFDTMQVWDHTGLGYTRYNARDVGKEILGCVVENKVLHSSLLSCLQNADLQNTIYPARLTSMTSESESPFAKKDSQPFIFTKGTHRGSLMKLHLSDDSNIYTKLVVGADGAKSRVREIAGLRTTGWNYSQHAIICTVEHTAENQCAWQRFLPSGPIALLPIGDRFSNIVWTMSPSEASDHKSMNGDDFVKAVNHALDYGYGPQPRSGPLSHYIERFSSAMGGVTPSGNECFQVPPKIIKVGSEKMAFPLSLMHAHDYASHRVVLIGDAAHTVHPLAGQGVNLGFGDVLALSKVIAEGILVGADIGELSLLKKYEMERKTANIAMMAILDGFQKAFSVDLGPINLLRAAAFHGAQYFGPLKKSIISYATGTNTGWLKLSPSQVRGSVAQLRPEYILSKPGSTKNSPGITSAAGRFKDEIIPVATKIVDPKTGEEKHVTIFMDNGIRPSTTVSNLEKLRPVLKKDGTTTAGNSSQVSDGAGAVLLMKRSVAMQKGLPILGVFRSFVAVGVDPAVMGIGPAVTIPAAVIGFTSDGYTMGLPSYIHCASK